MTLYDNGQGFDRVANDGIYTATASVRTSTPLGAHEIFVQASDAYGDATPPTSFIVLVKKPMMEELGSDEDGLTIIAIVVGVLAYAGLLVYFRFNQSSDERKTDSDSNSIQLADNRLYPRFVGWLLRERSVVVITGRCQRLNRVRVPALAPNSLKGALHTVWAMAFYD